MTTSPSVAPADAAGREIPAHDVVPLAPRRARYAVCLFVINEAERLHRQLAKMQAVDHGLDVVLADGGSTDGSTDPARLAAASRSTNRGSASGSSLSLPSITTTPS